VKKKEKQSRVMNTSFGLKGLEKNRGRGSPFKVECFSGRGEGATELSKEGRAELKKKAECAARFEGALIHL